MTTSHSIYLLSLDGSGSPENPEADPRPPRHLSVKVSLSPPIGNTNSVFLVCITLSFNQFLGQLWGQKLKEWPSIRCSATVFHHHYHTPYLLKLSYYTSVLHLLQFPFRSLLHIISTLLASILISALCFQHGFNYPTQNSYHIKHFALV